ncbi:MAG: NUDIX domain-containing protein, partial [Candidatus Dormibacteraeota bacterium]|nr:NUDIX domain-containing protein [Candidatus Dormibacteraeota bacterium]
MLFDPAADTLPLLFMLRSSDLRQHAGQIAFPGGSVEESDRDVVDTALREAREEMG